jgi:hypothetical protein
MIKKLFLFSLVFSLIILAGCTNKDFQCEDFCGDGICVPDPCQENNCACPETPRSCALDCQ